LERGRQLASERMEDVKGVASAAYGTVREEADRQGLNAESGQGLIDKAAQVARAGLDAAKQEAGQRRPH
jgi:Pyruvate/2-oxoacid:ferredoxin oxidoreductase gamma subunit